MYNQFAKYALKALLVMQAMLFNVYAQSIITTVAGNGTGGYAGDSGLATSCEINNTTAIAFDSSGNLFIADANNNRIRKINTSGIITTIAGIGTAGYNGDNILANTAELNEPFGLAFDKSGNLFIADWGNNRIRKINSSGIITTVAGTGVAGYNGDNTLATSAQLNSPYMIAFDTSGNLYISEEVGNRIRKINTSGIITTTAGTGTAGYSGNNGPATSAQLYAPGQISFDALSNLYFADDGNNCIRKINTSGIITTIAGTGTAGYTGDNNPAISAKLYLPFGIVSDEIGNIYIADTWNMVIRKINTSGIITTIVGNGTGAGGSCGGSFGGDNGPAISAELNAPTGLAFDVFGNLYIADECNNRIRKVTNVTTGINEIKNKNVSLNVFPNPTSNTISLNIIGVLEIKNSIITIQNILGEEIKKLSFTKSIDVTELSQGCYFIQITLPSGENYKTKFIKQ